LLKSEGEVGFGWHIEFFAASEGLGTSSGGTSGESPDGCPFAAASNGADERPRDCAPADVFAGPLVFAYAFFLI
jgi:hypothetical protein